jgi:hypothetical protein
VLPFPEGNGGTVADSPTAATDRRAARAARPKNLRPKRKSNKEQKVMGKSNKKINEKQRK